MPETIKSMADLVGMLDKHPDGFVVFFQFKEGGPRRVEIMQRKSTFHRLPDAVYGSIKDSPNGAVISQIIFTESLFAKPFPMTAMTFEEERNAKDTTALTEALAQATLVFPIL